MLVWSWTPPETSLAQFSGNTFEDLDLWSVPLSIPPTFPTSGDNGGAFPEATTAPPEPPVFKALLLFWPTWLSYELLFIAVVWANHHYLMRYIREANSLSLSWFKFAHLFSMSLL